MPQPNPGSKEALIIGCKCPVIDNHYGKGIDMDLSEPQFWISGDCPIHSQIKQ